MKFNSVIKLEKINPYIVVSKTRSSQLKPDWKKPLPVLVRVNGMPRTAVSTNLMPKGEGVFYLYLHEGIRKASMTKVGDRVEVELRFNSQYKSGPAHPMPAWFRSGLSKNKRANMAWERLIPSRQKEVLRYFDRLKSDAAKERNLELVLSVLSGVEARFMARLWKDGK